MFRSPALLTRVFIATSVAMAGPVVSRAADNSLASTAIDNKPAVHSNARIDVPPIPADELAKVEGRWLVVRHWTDGTGFGSQDGSGEPLGPEFVFSGRNFIYRFRPNDPKSETTRYSIRRVDVSTNPKQFDVAFEKDGQTLVRRGIYLMDENFIHSEFSQPGEPRPKEFQSRSDEENRTDFLILRRAKK